MSDGDGVGTYCWSRQGLKWSRCRCRWTKLGLAEAAFRSYIPEVSARLRSSHLPSSRCTEKASVNMSASSEEEKMCIWRTHPEIWERENRHVSDRFQADNRSWPTLGTPDETLIPKAPAWYIGVDRMQTWKKKLGYKWSNATMPRMNWRTIFLQCAINIESEKKDQVINVLQSLKKFWQ